MGSWVINHGITDIDYDAFQKVVDESEQKKTSVYEKKSYIATRQGDQKEITDKCAVWYKHSSYGYKIKNEKFRSFFLDSFFEKYKMKPYPVDIIVWRFEPGQFTPPHLDNMETFKEMYGINDNNITRIWISLSEPAFGHALMVGKDQVAYNLPRGTTLQIDFINELHSGVNGGITDRYLITITGVKIG